MRREHRAAGGVANRGPGPSDNLGHILHGDIGQDQSQCHGAVSGAAQHGENALCLAAAGYEKAKETEEGEEVQGDEWRHTGER